MPSRAIPWFRGANLAIIAGLLALTYFVILGDVGQRDPPTLIMRILHAAAAGTLILAYLLTAPRRADRVDRGVLLGLLLFAAAAVLAQFPRQAFDALLAALLYTAALFVGRTLLASETGRVAFVRCLMGLSALLAFLTAARWLLPALEWWSLTDWRVIPPLDMNLYAAPWGHRHDLALMIALLYPAWWIGRITLLRAAVATVVGILTLLIVLVDGSRTVWLAMGVATAALVVTIGWTYWPSNIMRQATIGLALAAGVAAVLVSGILGPVLERLLSSESVEARWAMWGPLTEAWLAKPVAGYGPGSFPWVLQQTDYFQTNSWAPRHPDSPIFQLLPEAGLLGVLALVVVVVTLLPAIFRSHSRAARWALFVFVLASVGANPTDFGFLVAVAIGWVAFAIPREPNRPIQAPKARRLTKAAAIAGLGVIAVAWTATAAADIAYLAARSAISNGSLGDATARLELANTLDPGMALYARQLGTAQLLLDDTPAAIQNLDDAINLNPSDDLAWRVLALAHAASGDSDSAWAALAEALETQRSDPTNLLLAAMWQTEEGNDQEALATLGEVVQAWPEIVAAPGWTELLPTTISTRDVIEVALDRWSRDRPSPEPRSLQPLLLAVMAGRGDLAEESAQELLGASLGAAYLAVMGCDPSASLHLEQAPDQARRGSLYWSLVAREMALHNQTDEQTTRLLEIMTNDPLFSSSTDETLNPLNENGAGGFSADTWGYRRIPIAWPDYEGLPYPRAGAARWLFEPRDAVDSAGLDMSMEACR